jgi:SAM-dependent methyltransferase
VLGVEPDVRMAAWARERGLDVEVARFGTWNPANREFDAVIAGTAWHWVDSVVGAAKAAHVLRPGGRLAPFHHVFQLPPALADASVSVYQRILPDSPVIGGNVAGLAVGDLGVGADPEVQWHVDRGQTSPPSCARCARPETPLDAQSRLASVSWLVWSRLHRR